MVVIDALQVFSSLIFKKLTSYFIENWWWVKLLGNIAIIFALNICYMQPDVYAVLFVSHVDIVIFSSSQEKTGNTNAQCCGPEAAV